MSRRSQWDNRERSSMIDLACAILSEPNAMKHTLTNMHQLELMYCKPAHPINFHLCEKDLSVFGEVKTFDGGMLVKKSICFVHFCLVCALVCHLWARCHGNAGNVSRQWVMVTVCQRNGGRWNNGRRRPAFALQKFYPCTTDKLCHNLRKIFPPLGHHSL